MDVPLADLMDEQACYRRLLQVLHPDGLHCPKCQSADGWHVHRRHREPVLDYRCSRCGAVFNGFSGTVLCGTHKRPSELLLILRGVVQGVSTAQLSRELHLARGHLLDLRHDLQAKLLKAQTLQLSPSSRLKTERELEADEMYQNAGKKRPPSRPRYGQTASPRQPPCRPR